MNDKEVSKTVKVKGFTFTKELTIGKDLMLYGRRSALCNGQYGALSISPELSEQMAAITAHRIATLEAHLDDADDEFRGFEKISPNELGAIWKEFADKAGLFPKDDPKPKEKEKT